MGPRRSFCGYFSLVSVPGRCAPRQTAPPSPAERSPREEGSTIVQSLVWLTTTLVVRTEIPPVRSPLFSKGEISESERT